MSLRGRARQEIIAQDVRDLARLGYAPQLFREMGGFSNFAISFSIISVLTGAVLLFGYGLKFAGPVVNSVGWPVVSVFTLAVAASMAELAPMYPTAGGLYFWAFRLGGRGWAWITAWLNMIGQVTITAGINVAAAAYIIGAVTRMLGVPADVAAGFLLQSVTTTTPLAASSVDFGGGRTAPALVIADVKLPSPLFALLPGLAAMYAAAPLALVFARDDGFPGARFLKRVHARHRTPSCAIVVTSVLALLITAYAAAYSVVTSISTITLYLAYVILIYLNWRNRRRGRGEHTTPVTAPWTLGRAGGAVNVIAIAWVVVITVVFALPPNELVLWTMVLTAAILGMYWRLSARRRFAGPAVLG